MTITSLFYVVEDRMTFADISLRVKPYFAYIKRMLTKLHYCHISKCKMRRQQWQRRTIITYFVGTPGNEIILLFNLFELLGDSMESTGIRVSIIGNAGGFLAIVTRQSCLASQRSHDSSQREDTCWRNERVA